MRTKIGIYLFIALVGISLFALTIGAPRAKFKSKNFLSKIATFPTNLEKINSITAKSEESLTLPIPPGYENIQVFIGPKLENLDAKIYVADQFRQFAGKLIAEKSTEEQKVFSDKSSKNSKQLGLFLLNKSGELYYQSDPEKTPRLLATFSTEYFKDISLFKALVLKNKKLLKISDNTLELNVNIPEIKDLGLSTEGITVVYYKKGKKQSAQTATEIIFSTETADSALKDNPVESLKNNPAELSQASNQKTTADTKVKSRMYTRMVKLSNSSSSNSSSSSDGSSSSRCTCNMVLLLDGLELGDPLEKDSNGRVIGKFLATEGLKNEKFEFTFYDKNNCGSEAPKLTSLSVSDEPRNNPWKNHANRRSLKFDVKVKSNGTSATLNKTEALWYGVKKNATDEICGDMYEQSTYNLTFDAKFDQSECDSVEVDTMSVVDLGLDAKSSKTYAARFKSGIFSESYIKPGSPQQCCTDINPELNPHPLTCKAKETYEGDPEEYGQFWEKTKAEEEFHSQQGCSPSVPFTKGGLYGPGGPFNPASILSKMPQGGVCVNVATSGGWFSSPASRIKKACVESKKKALQSLADIIVKHYRTVFDSKHLQFRAWLEWTAKQEIGVTEFLRTAYHYACAYGLGPEYPDNNPPKPTF